MWFDYAIRAYEFLERRLTAGEKAEIYRVYLRIGDLMHIPDLAGNYTEFLTNRQRRLERDLEYSTCTSRLYR